MNGAGKPLVSIGLMVYNEEKYIASAFKSISEQDFFDYEIIVGDNASTDRTGEIALEYASRDTRIRYFKHPKNIGALENFNYLARHASGKYFILAGGHDLWSSNYVSLLSAALENNPIAVLAHTSTVWLTDTGEVTGKKTGFIDTSGQDILGRFNLTMWNNQNAMYGMYRVSALQKTRLQLDFVGSGAVLLGELALQGDIIHVPGATWYRRMNRKLETRRERMTRYHDILFEKPRPVLLTNWRTPLEFIISIIRFRVSFLNKILLLLSALTSFIRYGESMFFDVVLLLQLDRIFGAKNNDIQE